jgi:c-di-GMP-binding flagellar brake protein YcgR
MPLKERRKSQRVSVDWPAVIWSSKGAFSGGLKDISAGGACLITSTLLKPKERLSLYVAPDNHRTFRVDSKVVWLHVDCSKHNSSSCTMGIRFTKVSEIDRQGLEGAISNKQQAKETSHL